MAKQFRVLASKSGFKTFDFTYDAHEESYARKVANTLSDENWSVWFETLDDKHQSAVINDLDFVFGKTQF
jgi:hypothetical protein